MPQGTRRVVHDVVPNKKQGGWDDKVAGKTVGHHETKDPAVDAAIAAAKAAPLGQVKIHKQDGKIQEERTYGKDPEKYPG